MPNMYYFPKYFITGYVIREKPKSSIDYKYFSNTCCKTWKNIFELSAQANKTMRNLFTEPPFCTKFVLNAPYTSIISIF